MSPGIADRSRFLAPYSANHERVRKIRGRAGDRDCMDCGCKAMDWACMHGEDGSHPLHYLALCRRCHYRYDQETQSQGPVKRSRNPSWLASRQQLKRDELGRWSAE